MASFVQVELSGGRELVNEERAELLLKELDVAKPTHIRLSNKSFDNAAAEKIASFIGTLDSLKVADISDIIAGRPEDEALRTLTIICSSLRKFNLLEVDLSDNALGAKGVEACRDVLIGNNLEKLKVCNNGLSAEACELLRDILLRMDSGAVAAGADATSTAPHAQQLKLKLKLLHCFNNMSGDGGAMAMGDLIRAAPQLEDFRYSATRSTKTGCMSVATALALVPNLRRLDLSDNNFSGKTGEELSAALKTKSQLEYVNLRDDAMGAAITVAVTQAVASGSGATMAHLDISGNDVDVDAAAGIAAAVEQMPNLTALLIDDCDLGTEGAKCIAKAIAAGKLPKLRTLSCCTCEITAAGAYYLARSVSKLPSFVNLELNGNQITEGGVQAVQTLFNAAGKLLGDLEDNDEDGEDDLEDAIEELGAEGAEIVDAEADELAEAIKKTNI